MELNLQAQFARILTTLIQMWFGECPANIQRQVSWYRC